MMQRPVSSLLLATLLSLVLLGPGNAFQVLPMMRLSTMRMPTEQPRQPTFLSATLEPKRPSATSIPSMDPSEGASPEDYYQDIVEFKAPDSDKTETEKSMDMTSAVIALRRRLQPTDFDTIFDTKNPLIGEF